MTLELDTAPAADDAPPSNPVAEALLMAAEECEHAAGDVRRNKHSHGVKAEHHPVMDARIADLLRAAETCRNLASAPVPATIECYVAEMKTSAGTDYYVTIAVSDRRSTPHKYSERWKAEYDVAFWNHVLNGAPKPQLIDYGPPPASADERQKQSTS